MSVLRGLRYRAGANLLMLVVAIVASAAAAAAPTYYSASQRSILVDTVASAPVVGRGIGVLQAGGLAGSVDPLVAQTEAALSADVGPGVARRDFAPPIEALEGGGQYRPLGQGIPVVWRSGACAHLSFRGSCPAAPGQVLVSAPLAAAAGWRSGQHVILAGWRPFTITGIYAPPARPGDYWFDRASTYFAAQSAATAGAGMATAVDAMFTTRATVENDSPAAAQGATVVDVLMDLPRVRGGDEAALEAGVSRLAADPAFNEVNATVTSEIPATLSSVRTGWSTLAVPVVVITAQLLGLGWLLLFLLVGDAVESRGAEVALARLRGAGWWRVTRFAVSEPTAILLAALPIGAVAGWGAAAVLAGDLLRPGTPVGIPALGWAAAAGATLGGLAAVALASRRTLRRPVVEQWRRTGRRATDRGWVLDAVLLVAAAGGLLELFVSGQVGSAGHRVLSLLVPGLLGLAVAVAASRALPLVCRTLADLTRHRGLAAFLALRQVARRPGGTRTTMLLTTAFALATFALSAWLVGQANYGRVADAQVGAPTVLTVSVPQGAQLPAVVDRVDPSGRTAAAVEVYGSGDQTTLAVQPARFARVASWAGSLPPARLAALAARLQPAEPAAVTLSGSQLRVTLTARSVGPRPGDLVVDVVTPTSTGPAPVDLGTVPADGTAVLSASLPGCPCTVADVQLTLQAPGLGGGPAESGTITLTGMDQLTSAGWLPVPGAVSDGSRWRPVAPGGGSPSERLGAGPEGLVWSFDTPAAQNPDIQSADRPVRLPALAAASLAARPGGAYTAVGLDGTALPVRVLATAPVIPGAPADGVVVAARFADLAAAGDTPDAQQQVWVAAGSAGVVRARLAAAGVTVTSVRTEASARAFLSRQGPALASVLYLADAAAAAALAAVGALAGLYAFARRRTFEYAALQAAGMSRASLRRSLFAEQALVLGFAVAVGVGAGIAAVAAALRSVPEFLTVPTAPALSYAPTPAGLGAVLGGLVAVLAVVAAVSAAALMSRVRLEQLREAQA